MATKPMISVEEYLRSAWPDGDREYVAGEVIEKPMPPKAHAKIQKLLILLFHAWEASHGLTAFAELRCRLGASSYRLPDVAVFLGEPEEEVPSLPAYVVVEILSPDDRMPAMMEKLREYRAWGVAHIWVIEPASRTLHEFGSDGLREVASLRMPELALEIGYSDLFPQRAKPL